MSRPALPEEILLEDGSVHQCRDENGGTATFRPLAQIDGKRYYCTDCGIVIVERDGVFRATGAIIPEDRRRQ